MEDAEIAEIAEGPAPAPTAEGPVPAPAPAATLEKSMSDHTPRIAKKSTDNFGRLASTNSDFSYGLYLNLDQRIPSTTLTFL